MRLLLDTVAVLLLSNDDPRMSSAVKAAYRNPANSAYVSVVSIWEILVKSGLGKLPFQVSIDDLLNTMKADGTSLLPLELSAVRRVVSLPSIHRDPFDRMLICQAIDDGLSTVTPDTQIRKYPVATIW